MIYGTTTVSGYADLHPKWPQPKPVVLRDYTSRVCAAFGVTRAGLCSDQRHRPLAYARFALCLLLRDERKLSYSQIGRLLGGRDHSTIINACTRARGLLDSDAQFAARYREARG